MGKMIVHEFDPGIYPRKLWVCLNADKDELLERFEFFPHPNGLDVALDRHAASCSSVRIKDGDWIGVMLFTTNKKYLDIQTIAHESAHIADYFFEELGMYTQNFTESNEPYTYFVGWAAKCISESIKYKKQPTTRAESRVENK